MKKTFIRNPYIKAACAVLTCLALSPASAQNLEFDPDGGTPTDQQTGNWNEPANPNVWFNGTSFGPWVDGRTAVFNEGSDTIAYLYAPVAVGGISKNTTTEQFTVVAQSGQTMTVNNGAVIFNATNTLALQGGVLAGGAFTKTGAGTLRLGDGGGDTFANTISGATVNAGELQLNKATNTAAIGGDVIVNGTGVITFYNNNQTTTTTNLQIDDFTSGGFFFSNAFTQTMGSLNINAVGSISAGVTNTMNLTNTTGDALKMRFSNFNNVTVGLTSNAAQSVRFDAVSNGTANVGGAMVFGGNVKTFNIDDGFEAADMRVQGNITETSASSLNKTGIGNLELNGSLTYSGNTTVAAGTLSLTNGSNIEFNIATSGVNNQINGVGIVSLDGAFTFDLTNAATNGTWNIVDVSNLSETYGANFTVTGFNNQGSGLWQTTANGATYQFSQISGDLTAVPEPGTVGLLLATGLFLGVRRFRKNR